MSNSMDFLQLTGKNILVMGVANRKSVAFHTGALLKQAGANVIYTVRSEQRKLGVQKLLGDAPILVCDVEHEQQINRLRDDVAVQNRPLHGLVHSIAFADYSDGPRPFHETSKKAFLRAVDISCYSLIAVANALKDLWQSPSASVRA
jgi:enoyl-[acyl-carrier protein] reductase I